MQQGLLEEAREMVIDAIEAKFGECPSKLREKISTMTDRTKLKAMHRLLFKVESLAEFQTEAFE
jgi:hypothetical protein